MTRPSRGLAAAVLVASTTGCASRRATSPVFEGRLPACADLLPDDGQGGDWQADPEQVGLFTNAARLYLLAYKRVVSPADGDRCGMFPSCSAYTERAVRLYGPVHGGWLGAARILADHADPDLPRCVEAGRLLRVDLPDEVRAR